MTVGVPYPVRVDATLDPQLSRWLWLVKWVLVVPHYVVLAFLWVAFVVVSVIAFFAILVTGRYPLALFEFNVGVLRWSWRVACYSYGALATDHYPPFTLAEVSGYPAHLEVAYPAHLSRGLVLVKSWLLAVPHYLVVGVFLGGGLWAAWQTDRTAATAGPGGLIGLLVLVAAVVLLVTGRYPQTVFDLVLGLNRWVLRVAAYAALMTDTYPPFRLDMGGHDPGTVLVSPPGTADPGAGGMPAPTVPAPGTPAPGVPAGRTSADAAAGAPRLGWTGGRIVALVAGCLAGLVALGLLTAGGAATWLNVSERDAAGYVTSPEQVFVTPTSALTSGEIDLGTSDVAAPADVLGTVRIRVTATDPSRAVFVGIAPRSAADAYLAGVGHAVITGWTSTRAAPPSSAAGLPVRPATLGIWSAWSSGLGTQQVTWRPTAGSWTVVVMNADGRRGVSVRADAGATIPALRWIAVGLLVGGALLLVAAVLLVVGSARRASRRPTVGPPGGPFVPTAPGAAGRS